MGHGTVPPKCAILGIVISAAVQNGEGLIIAESITVAVAESAVISRLIEPTRLRALSIFGPSV